MGEPLLARTLILIGASVATVAALRRLGLPAILGYFLAGLAVGPHGLGLVAPDGATRFLAQLGLVFLMFTGGLEFSVPAMFGGRGDVFVAGALQVSVTTLLSAGVAILLGAAPGAALLVGGAVASSSTAVVMKQLTDQGELGTRVGRLTVGILLFQDLAVLPFLVALGAYSGGAGAGSLAIVRHIAFGGLALAGTAVIGRPLFRGALAFVAASQSAELILMAILLMALGAAWAAGMAGLAAPLGAFMAGMLVGESDVRHHAQDEIRPFRDVLMGLFFVTVGMGLDLRAVWSAPMATLVWLATFLLMKPAVVLLAARLRGWPGEEGLRVSLAFANGGEFGLLLVTQGLAARLVGPTVGGPLLLALVTSMGLTPMLMPLWPVLAGKLRRLAPPGPTGDVASAADELADHVLLCGCGRIGRCVAEGLQAAGFAYIALEKDFHRFRYARNKGLQVLFADASRLGVLEAAGLGRIRLLVLTFDLERDAGLILESARRSQAQAPRLASASDEESAAALTALGADVVFPENLAAGLGLADQTLLLCGLNQAAAARVVTELRARLSPELAGSAGL